MPTARAGDSPSSTAAYLTLDNKPHTGIITRLAVCEDKHVMATGSHDKTVRIWNLDTGELLQTLHPPIATENFEGRIGALAISPDGSTIACGGRTGKTWGSFCVYEFNRVTCDMTLAPIGGIDHIILDLAYSPDGNLLAIGYGGGVRVVNARTGATVADPPECRGNVSSVAFTRDARLVCAAFTRTGDKTYSGALYLYDSSFRFKKKAPLPGLPMTVRTSPCTDRLAVGYRDANPAVEVYSTEDLSLCATPNSDGVGDNLSAVSWSPDGNTLYAGGKPQNGKSFIREWPDGGTGAPTDIDVPTKPEQITATVALSDGSLVYATDGPATARIDRTGTPIFQLESPGYPPNATGALKVSSDGDTVQFPYGTSDAVLQYTASELWLGDPKRDQGAAGVKEPVTSAGGVDATQYFGSKDIKIHGRGTTYGTKQNEHIDCACYSADMQEGLVGGDFGVALVNHQHDMDWDLAWNQPTPDKVRAVNLTANGLIAVAALADGTIRWYSTRDGSLLLSLFVADEGDRWVAWTASGYYWASAGAEDLAGWTIVRGGDQAAEFYPLSRFRDGWCRPDVVSCVVTKGDEAAAVKAANDDVAREYALAPAPSLLAQNPPAPVAPAPNLVAPAPPTSGPAPSSTPAQPAPVPPSVVLAPPMIPAAPETSPTSAQPTSTPKPAAVAVAPPPVVLAPPTPPVDSLPPTLTITSPESGSTVTSPQVKIKYLLHWPQDAPVADALDVRVDGSLVSFPTHRDLQVEDTTPREITVPIPTHDCIITLIARNKNGESEPATIHILWKGITSTETPEAKLGTLHLLCIGVNTYHDPDNDLKYAKKDAQDIADAFTRYVGPAYEHVEAPTILFDDNATLVKIEKALRAIKPRPDDLAVIFLSGHGWCDPHDGTFYFICHDTVTPAESDISTTALDVSELQKTLKNVNGPTLLLIDACHSGSISGTRTSVPSQSNVGITRFDNEITHLNAPVAVLSAATYDSSAEEDDAWQNGAFTKALKQGLSGEARDNKGSLDIDLLAHYVEDTVKSITHGEQRITQCFPMDVDPEQFRLDAHSTSP